MPSVASSKTRTGARPWPPGSDVTSVQRRPSGKWRARYVDPLGHERAQHFDTKDAAEAFLAMQVVRMRDGTWIDPLHGRRLFRTHAVAWSRAQLQHRDSTAGTTANRLVVLTGHFGDVPLASITRPQVQAWVVGLSETYSPKSVEALYRLMAQVMLAAVHDGYLHKSPCWKINLPEDEAPVDVPLPDEVAALYAAAPPHAKALILAGIGTGLRISEMAGLTVDRVDFLRRQVTVDRQLVGTHLRQPVFGPPKTKAGNRVIPVPQDVIDEIAAHLAAWPSESVVFRTAHGMPWTRRTLAEELRRWRRHAARADVERASSEGRDPYELERLTFKSLRHYYASGLINAGLSPTAVAARLGHADASITLRVYSHLWPTDDEATRTAAEGLVSNLRATAAEIPSGPSGVRRRSAES